jgi:hypothetical protein
VHDMHAYGVKPGPTILTQLLRSSTLESTPASAKSMAVRLWKRLKALDAPLSVESYNAMLAVSLRDDPEYVAHALAAVAEMQQQGLPLRTDTLNSVMNVAVENADFVQVCCHCVEMMSPAYTASNDPQCCMLPS